MRRGLPVMALIAGVLAASLGTVQAAALGDYSSHRVVRGGVEVTVGRAVVRIVAYRPEIVRVSCSFDRAPAPAEPSWSVSAVPAPGVHVVATADDSAVTLTTQALRVEASKRPFRLAFFDRAGRRLLAEPAAGGMGESGREKRLRFVIQEGDHFFGFGQKGIPVDRRGRSFAVFNRHVGGYSKPWDQQQINVPFFHSPLGYGLLVDNNWPARFDMGEGDRGQWTFAAEDGPLAFFFMVGARPDDVLRQYYTLTGFPPIPPRWAFGLLQSKCSYENEAEVRRIVATFRAKRLPLDAVILDGNWFGGFTPELMGHMGDLAWHRGNFPEAEGMMRDLKAQGVKTLVISEPYVNTTSVSWPYLDQQGWLVRKRGQERSFVISPFWARDVSLLDVTHPGAQAWLWSRLKTLIQGGIDGLWTDLGEPETPVSDAQYHLGSDRQVHNLYNLIWAKTIADGFARDFPDRRLINLSRAGCAGIQRYSVFSWSGDSSKTFAGLRLQLPMLIGMASSGVPYFGSDVGGFTDVFDADDGGAFLSPVRKHGFKTTPELFARWMQFGTFSPMLRPHSGEGQACEPFAFDERTEEIAAAYVRLRYELLPFIYSYAHRTWTRGEALVRPLFFEWPDDPRTYRLDYEYLFGREMLVAPVFGQGEMSRDVYLPGGTGQAWADFWTDQLRSGGRTILAEAPPDRIPVFVRQPAIFPMGRVKNWSDESPDEALTLRVYPGGAARFELVEDDGTTLAYQRGRFATTLLTAETVGRALEVRVGAMTGAFDGQVEQRRWTVETHLVKGFKGVTVAGHAGPALPGRAALEREDGFWWDQERGILYVTASGATRAPLVIRAEGVALAAARR